MTFEEMGKSMKELRDNQIVQGEILHRIDTRLDRLEVIVERNSLAIAQNTEAIAKLTDCLLYTSPSPRDLSTSRMPSSA